MHSFDSISVCYALFFIFFTSVFITFTPIHGLDQPIRKLDESPVPGEEKCDLCNPSPPPPVPSPPPPAPVLSPPPPPSGYCPPPPATPSIIYITSPPGGLYPIDNDFSGGDAVRPAGFPVLIGCGLLLGILMLIATKN